MLKSSIPRHRLLRMVTLYLAFAPSLKVESSNSVFLYSCFVTLRMLSCEHFVLPSSLTLHRPKNTSLLLDTTALFSLSNSKIHGPIGRAKVKGQQGRHVKQTDLNLIKSFSSPQLWRGLSLKYNSTIKERRWTYQRENETERAIDEEKGKVVTSQHEEEEQSLSALLLSVSFLEHRRVFEWEV